MSLLLVKLLQKNKKLFQWKSKFWSSVYAKLSYIISHHMTWTYYYTSKVQSVLHSSCIENWLVCVTCVYYDGPCFYVDWSCCFFRSENLRQNLSSENASSLADLRKPGEMQEKWTMLEIGSWRAFTTKLLKENTTKYKHTDLHQWSCGQWAEWQRGSVGVEASRWQEYNQHTDSRKMLRSDLYLHTHIILRQLF